MVSRTLILLYGVIVYAFFFVTFCYVFGFLHNLVVPKSIDSGQTGPIATSVLVNVSLLGAFAIQHLIMARLFFKKWWTTIIPPSAERTTFVLLATALVALLMWQWRPMTGVIWEVENSIIRAILIGISGVGLGIVLYSSFVIDHFDLFGLRQVWLHYRQIPYTHHPFSERSVYKYVRHPLMVGFMICFWATPSMTQGHLLFAAVTTAYIIVGVLVEERTLIGILGDAYVEYAKRTPRYIPLPGKRGKTQRPPQEEPLTS